MLLLTSVAVVEHTMSSLLSKSGLVLTPYSPVKFSHVPARDGEKSEEGAGKETAGND